MPSLGKPGSASQTSRPPAVGSRFPGSSGGNGATRLNAKRAEAHEERQRPSQSRRGRRGSRRTGRCGSPKRTNVGNAPNAAASTPLRLRASATKLFAVRGSRSALRHTRNGNGHRRVAGGAEAHDGRAVAVPPKEQTLETLQTRPQARLCASAPLRQSCSLFEVPEAR